MLLPACSVCGALGHESASCPYYSKGLAVSEAAAPAAVDFNDAGRALLARLGVAFDEETECTRDLGLAVDASCRYAALSEIWRSPSSSASVFVGGLQTARSSELLRKHGITHIVNCMNASRFNKELGVAYYNFPIEQWHDALPTVDAEASFARMKCDSAAGLKLSAEEMVAVREFFAPAMQFIFDAVAAGHNVLIHCFAGAHRAGSAGVAFLMHAEQLTAEEALAVAQKLRPIIDPKAYHGLWSLLLRLESALCHERSHISMAAPPP